MDHTDPFPDQPTVMTPRPITAIHSGNARVQTQPAANVIDNQLRDFLVPWKPAIRWKHSSASPSDAGG